VIHGVDSSSTAGFAHPVISIVTAEFSVSSALVKEENNNSMTNSVSHVIAVREMQMNV